MTRSSAHRPNPTDLLSVKSRVSWGAIAAGAMVALAVYFVLAMLGVALSIEVASRGTSPQLRGRGGDLLDPDPAARHVLRRAGRPAAWPWARRSWRRSSTA